MAEVADAIEQILAEADPKIVGMLVKRIENVCLEQNCLDVMMALTYALNALIENKFAERANLISLAVCQLIRKGPVDG